MSKFKKCEGKKRLRRECLGGHNPSKLLQIFPDGFNSSVPLALMILKLEIILGLEAFGGIEHLLSPNLQRYLGLQVFANMQVFACL